MNVEVPDLLNKLRKLKEQFCQIYSFEDASVLADAVIVIEHLQKRPLSEEETRENERKRLLKIHGDALQAVYNYFSGQVANGELIDPDRVKSELQKTIKDFS